MVKAWPSRPAPQWGTYIPSLNHPDLVLNFAKRVADTLGLAFVAYLRKVRYNSEQKEMFNSYQQVMSLKGLFAVNNALTEYCLLIDDIEETFPHPLTTIKTFAKTPTFAYVMQKKHMALSTIF